MDISKRDREIYKLRQQGLSFSEIGKRVGITGGQCAQRFKLKEMEHRRADQRDPGKYAHSSLIPIVALDIPARARNALKHYFYHMPNPCVHDLLGLVRSKDWVSVPQLGAQSRKDVIEALVKLGLWEHPKPSWMTWKHDKRLANPDGQEAVAIVSEWRNSSPQTNFELAFSIMKALKKARRG